jgi:hypothetical protein
LSYLIEVRLEGVVLPALFGDPSVSLGLLLGDLSIHVPLPFRYLLCPLIL